MALPHDGAVGPHAPRRAVGQVLVKPAGADCDLRCAYCFYLPKKALYAEARPRMSGRVLAALVEKVLAGGAPVVSFGWQGGEPSLMGLDFFRRTVALQQAHARPGQIVQNSLQTNGVRLDDEWCDFLGKNRFLVGLSLEIAS